MSEIPGYKEPITKEVTKRTLKSTTDPDCGYINQKEKGAWLFNRDDGRYGTWYNHRR